MVAAHQPPPPPRPLRPVPVPAAPPDPIARQEDAARRAEEALLGALLFDPEAIGAVRAVVAPEDFLLLAHAQAYRCLLGLHRRGQPGDIVHLADALERTYGGDALLDPADLSALAVALWQNGAPQHAVAYAALVAEHAARRRLREEGMAKVRASFGPDAPIAPGPPPALCIRRASAIARY